MGVLKSAALAPVATTLASGPASAAARDAAIGTWRAPSRCGVVEIARRGPSPCGKLVDSDNPGAALSLRDAGTAARNLTVVRSELQDASALVFSLGARVAF